MTEEERKLVATLRYCDPFKDNNAKCSECPTDGKYCIKKNGTIIQASADLIESLSAQLDQVTRERDAAIRQQLEADKNNPFACNFCKHDEVCDGRLLACGDCDMDCPCNTCIDHDKWQWRGVEVEG